MPPPDQLTVARDLIRDGVLDYVDGRFQLTGPVTDRQRRYLDPWLTSPGDTEAYYPKTVEFLLQQRAKRLLTRAWEQVGGPRSAVGLPEVGLTPTRAGEEWTASFRSGTVVVRQHETVVTSERRLIADFVGLECHVRQEKSDDLYGVVAVVGPANAQIKTYRFPGGDGTISMGRDGERIWNGFENLYQGPIEKLVLVATLIEHDDFTDVEGASRRIADKIAEAGGKALGALTGAPAEQVTEETWFRDGLATAVGVVLGDVFGAGDDPYAAQSLVINWTEIGKWGPPPQLPRTRSDDPKTIPHWTHRIKVTGHDDGGDYGDYDFYFNLYVREDSHVEAVPHPQ